MSTHAVEYQPLDYPDTIALMRRVCTILGLSLDRPITKMTIVLQVEHLPTIVIEEFMEEKTSESVGEIVQQIQPDQVHIVQVPLQ